MQALAAEATEMLALLEPDLPQQPLRLQRKHAALEQFLGIGGGAPTAAPVTAAAAPNA